MTLESKEIPLTADRFKAVLDDVRKEIKQQEATGNGSVVDELLAERKRRLVSELVHDVPALPAASTALVPRPPVALPRLIGEAGTAASFAWVEFFRGRLPNRHTRAAYLHAVRRFLAWAEPRVNIIAEITPGMVGEYFDQHPGSVPTKKLHLSAIRSFFDVLVLRHICLLNPAATVRGEKHQDVEGKTPEIRPEQARSLLASLNKTEPVGRRDAAIIATLIYTAARAGAVAGLRIKDFQWDGIKYTLRFTEKGGKSRLIPVQHKLYAHLSAYLESIGWKSQPADSPLFRAAAGRTGRLTEHPLSNVDICRTVKRRIRAAGLPDSLSPHSFRVATVTDLLTQGVPLEDVQYLAGHADARTTTLYDRRQKQVATETVEKISI